MVKIKSSDGGEFDAYVALPASGYGPGIVVLQEIFGVNQFLRSIADWYAARGFVAICPDLFWRQERGVELTDQSEAEWQKAFQLYQGLDVDKAIDDAAASLEFLRQHPACSGRAGAVGFCLGGNLAWLLSVRYKPDCAVGYYGVGIEKTLTEVNGLANPLMLHIAGRDDHCPPEAQKQIHATLDENPLVTIYDYPNSEHAFSRPGKHYDAAAAELAHLRSLEFFVRHLAGEGFANAQENLSDKWDEHVKYEFATRDTEDTLKTMVADAYVNHVPVMTGGVGHDQLRDFYSQRFIPQMPPDTSMTPVSRTIGTDRVVDEMVFEFTHTIKMDWMLPGVEPTNRHVKIPLIVVVHFRDGKLAHEHIYWDQASVLAQIGLIDAKSLPIAGVETAEKVLNPKLPANELMKR
ncbi:MAG TPA: dienelactone hydrolase family protein [Pyrinomonadaceae bacterium]|jgi:carboxymethylenebutenolidase|nr:dienelactone hydrolase family protein [Pyrinomonadaceae bacterium]